MSLDTIFGTAPTATPTATRSASLDAIFNPSSTSAASTSATPTTDTTGLDHIFKGTTPPPSKQTTSPIDAIKSGAGFLGDTATDIIKGGGNAISDAASKVMADAKKYNGSTLSGGLKGSLHVAGDIAGGVVGDIGGAIKGGIIDPASKLLEKVPGFDKLANSDAVGAAADTTNKGEQFLADKWNQFESAHPEAAKSIKDAGNIAQFMTLFLPDNPAVKDAVGSKVNAGTDAITNAVNKGNDLANSAVSNVQKGTSDFLSRQKGAMQSKAMDTVEQSLRDTTAKYTKPTDILQNAEKVGTKPIETIKMYGNKALPKLENGRLDSSEAVDFIHRQIGELSKLKNDAVFQNDAVISPEEFKSQALDTVKAEGGRQGWTQMKINQNLADVEKITDEVKNAYPNGIPLNEVDKIKTEQASLSNSYKNPNAKFQYDAHSVVGKTAKNLVEMFTEDAPTKELNKLIQSHYDAADLLDSLQGKTPHGGVLAKNLNRLAGEVVGATAGSAVGHPIIGAFAGRQSADLLSGALNSDFISNPLKRLLVNGMQETEPAAKTAMLKYLEENSPDIKDLGNQSLPNNLRQSQAPISTTKTAPITSKTIEPKVTTMDKNVNSLAQEATKYKSAEEFVNNPKFEYHLSNDPNLQEGRSFAEQVTKPSSGRRGFVSSEELGQVYSTNHPQFWDSQLSKELGNKAPKEVYLVAVKNPSPRGIIESGFDAQAINAPKDVVVIKKLATTGNGPLDVGRLEELKKSQLTDIWNKANKKQP